MTYHPDKWGAFFEAADPSQYSNYLHSSNGEFSSLQAGLPGVKKIKTAPSSYCQDLVTPMAELLRAALAESTSSYDKFVFVSESTLPVKPFPKVYEALTQDAHSDFCIAPQKRWLKVDYLNGETTRHGYLVKHSQWVVLSQAHAERMVREWPQFAVGHVVNWSLPVWTASGWTRLSGQDVDSGSQQLHSKRLPWARRVAPKIPDAKGALEACSDEWATFAAVFGLIEDVGRAEVVVPGLSNSPLWFDRRAIGQGRCRTFASWGTGLNTGAGSQQRTLLRQIAQLPSTNLSCRSPCYDFHPLAFDHLGDDGLMLLRKAPFLFARKFSAGFAPLQQFKRVILSNDVPDSSWTQ